MWDPFNEINRIRKEMNRMFKDFFERPERELISTRRPLTELSQPLSDIQETDKNIIVNLDMPGVDKKDIILTIRDNLLEVKAERKKEEKKIKKNLYQYERSYTGFYRVLPLPSSVKPEKAKAEYKDGVLTITIPKLKKEKLKGRKIEVQ